MAHATLRNARPARTLLAGFTLIELVVVTGIMVLIASLILANNNRFGGKVLLQNLAYDIALTVRQAQVYGISVERFSTNTFARAYGVHFQRNLDPSTQDQFILFADVIGANGIYDCPTPGSPNTCELVRAYAVRNGFHISDLCVVLGNGSLSCGQSSIDISFQRPNPDAFIRANGQSTLYASARVIITSPQGAPQTISVEQNGQISVQ